ncbi:MAG TPA: alpha/beta hydrolase, partial [Candidatus Methylomirabilis sp.]|nr:alpha/beta hydrolase [Candidatus Methylomirabilis sp.]
FSVAASFVGCKRHPMAPELRALYQLPYDSWQNRIATLRFVQDIPLSPGDRNFDLISDVAAGLDRFRDRPMLICWGELDFVFDRHFLTEWERRFPEAEIHRFADCGHYILEDAKEEVVPLIDRFLERTEDAP